ncbi:MAG: hypothetical protein PHH51_03390 [Bacilli bacterium]|nr:hypothetical protein [Bacilli bacterium]MDD3896101.1 hypothetical protein [Bacilli bacterium]
MSKLKGFYHNNRIYVILMGVSLLCLALILVAFGYYFLSQNNAGTYGNRLNGIENVKITDDKLEEMKKAIEENAIVHHASIKIKGKIVYINIYIKEDKIDDAKNVAIKSLELFEEEQSTVYDILFTIDLASKAEDSVYPIMGSKKNDNTIISWTKYGE